MADIFHHFLINASAERVFRAISSPAGLDSWWTKRSSGRPEEGVEYTLSFGPDFDWRAIVTRCIPPREFEMRLTAADQDWLGTRVGFVLEESQLVTQVRFCHTGWPETNEHFRISCFCWAMYLRLLKRYVEHGEVVSYEDRLDA